MKLVRIEAFTTKAGVSDKDRAKPLRAKINVRPATWPRAGTQSH